MPKKIFLVSIILIIGFVLGFLTRSVITKNQPTKILTLPPPVFPTPTPNFSDKPNNDYLLREFSMMVDKYRQNPFTSLYFGLTIKPFHPDWTCNPGTYSNEGFSVSCSTKACNGKLGLMPKPLSCKNGLIVNEYPAHYFSSYSIKTTEFNSTSDLDNLVNILKTLPQSSPQGIPFDLKKEAEKYFVNKYQAIFYSPKYIELLKSAKTPILPMEIYAHSPPFSEIKIETTLADENVDESLVKKIFGKIIDSIQFENLVKREDFYY